MGGCVSSAGQYGAARTVEEKEEEEPVIKMVLLGCAASGKSTLMKQAQLHFGDGFTDDTRTEHVSAVRHNTAWGMHQLCEASQQIGAVDAACRVLPQHEGLCLVMEALPWRNEWTQEVADCIERLWRDPGIQHTLRMYRGVTQVNDAMAWFMEEERWQRLRQPHYQPTEEDVVRCWRRTTGVMMRHFSIEGLPTRCYDVGGSRSDRRKWIHCLEDMNVACFVCPLTCYHQTLIEDPGRDELSEALEIWESVCGHQALADVRLVLVFTKLDTFRERLRDYPLSIRLPEFEGGNGGGQEEEEEDWRAAADCVQRQFLRISDEAHRDVPVFEVNGTDVDDTRSFLMGLAAVVASHADLQPMRQQCLDFHQQLCDVGLPEVLARLTLSFVFWDLLHPAGHSSPVKRENE